jgi:serine/threonine protein kinase
VSERAKQVLEVFEVALALREHQRSGWVRHYCSDDAELAAEVRSLLAAHQEADGFLDLGDGVSRTAPLNDNADRNGTAQHIGDFLIERRIGSGGMGLVYRAQQISLKRPVALKVLPQHLHSSASARSRFQREIEAAARLRHRNIVAVYTTGEDLGTIYYAMELIDGPALDRVIEQLRRRPLLELRSCRPMAVRIRESCGSTHSQACDVTSVPSTEKSNDVDLSVLASPDGYFSTVARLMADVAGALEYAHQMQVIHRDIKPSNLLLSPDGRIHVSDFGLARLAAEPGLTRTGDVLGTPFYMAPEQISDAAGAIDERTDVFSLGATLYELITLRPPFFGEHREQVIAKIAHDEPTPPRAINRQVPRDLDTICLKALEKQPARRYRSAGAMAEDLRRFANGEPILARRSGVVARSIKWVLRHRAVAAMLAGICASLVVALFFAYRTHVAESRWTEAEFGRFFETAQLAAMEGDLKRASRAIKQAKQLGAPPGQLSLLNGQLALQAGKAQPACDELELAVRELPESLAAHALLIKAYDANEQREKRIEIENRLLQLKPTTLQDYLLIGEAQSYSNFGEAKVILDEAVRRYKSSALARLTRGNVLTYRAMESANTDQAELALDDLRIAGELLEPNARLLSRVLAARLVAANAYASVGNMEKRQQHLDKAAITAEALKQLPDDFKSHQWRAFYFDYVGDDEQAMESWCAMKEHSITFLVVALHRLGRFQEALDLCNERKARFKNARYTDFLLGFIFAATDDTPQRCLAAFEPLGKEKLDSVNAHRFAYTIYCLAGDVDRARGYSRKLRASGLQLSANEQQWRDILEYSCGDLGENALLAGVADSRTALCEAHFLIGVTHLALGNRQEARNHFRASSEFKIPLCVEDHMSRALVAQLDRQPTWPKWISAR